MQNQYANPNNDGLVWTHEFEDELDNIFILRIQKEVTQSCSLPMALPVERIPEKIIQAAGWFWENVDMAVEQRNYLIKNSDICKNGKLNKIIQLPSQISAVYGVHRLQEDLRYGTMGDFSLERMMMSSYSMFGGAGIIGGGLGLTGGTGYTLSDVTMSLYEISTFNQYLNPPISYSFNPYSSKLNLIGALGGSDLIIEAFVRCRIQDLYNSHYFFRLCVCYCKQSLADIYGAWEFKLPGGVSINYSRYEDSANDEITKIEEWAEKNHASDYIMMPNTF
jgi:hypothetical protein